MKQKAVGGWMAIGNGYGKRLRKIVGWGWTITTVVERRFRQATPYVKALIVVSACAGPWSFAVQGAEGVFTLWFGLLIASYYTYLYRWDAGAIFGSFAAYFLGPVLVLLTPFVTN